MYLDPRHGMTGQTFSLREHWMEDWVAAQGQPGEQKIGDNQNKVKNRERSSRNEISNQWN